MRIEPDRFMHWLAARISLNKRQPIPPAQEKREPQIMEIIKEGAKHLGRRLDTFA